MSVPRSSSINNTALRTFLLRGALSVKVDGLDIRRANVIEIETDYILQISPSNDQSGNQPKLEQYSCSKRYVNIRDLANQLRTHAEEMVKYYEEDQKREGVNKNKSTRTSRTTLFGTAGGGITKGLEKLAKETVEAAQFLTNTEPSSLNLVSDLDKVSGQANERSNKQLRRTSNLLHQTAPLFIREILVGIDEFYEHIYSEKRQFGVINKKTNYDYVKNVAERRKKLINSAFEELLKALEFADLEDVDAAKRGNAGAGLPGSLEMLLKSLNNFFVTDVVEEEGGDKKVVTKSIADLKGGADDAIDSSVVNPKSTRRRASIHERKDEEIKCKDCGEELVMAEDEDEAPVSVGGNKPTDKETINILGDVRRSTVKIIPHTGMLPEDPMHFGIIIAVGAILFKALEGREVILPMDMLVMFGIACCLLGYQLAQRKAPVHAEKSTPNLVDGVFPTPVRRVSPKERALDRRAFLTKSSRATALKSYHNRQSLDLLQASLRNINSITMAEGEKTDVEKEPVVPAKTFTKFPEGEPIGSHFNCWSAPPSTNFKVRGQNYLKDKKKIPSADFLLPSRGCDLFLTDNPPVNIGRNRAILEGKLRDVPTFIINYRLPWGVFISYHEIPERFLPFLRRGQGYGDLSSPLPPLADMPPGERAVCNFFLSDTQEKNEVWKIVPVVVEGPWVVKRVVGGKPSIIGTKLPIEYLYQPPEKGLSEYLEADLDIVSSAAARNILAVVRSYTQVLTIDLGYVIQGNKAEELPEQMMLGLRLHGLDPLTAELLPDFDDGTSMPVLEEDGYDTE